MHQRQAGWLLTLGLFVPAAVGFALTASLFGAIFGLPLLALVAPPWWWAVRVLRRKSSFTRASTAWALAAAAGLTASLVVALAVGVDDLNSNATVSRMQLIASTETAVDLAAVTVSVGLLAVIWLGAIQARASLQP